MNLFSNLILDGQALHHLEIVEIMGRTKNISEGREKLLLKYMLGSLLHHLDHCVSQFGKRELKRWVCAPLTDVNLINERLDIIDDFIQNPELIDCLRIKLRKVNLISF